MPMKRQLFGLALVMCASAALAAGASASAPMLAKPIEVRPDCSKPARFYLEYWNPNAVGYLVSYGSDSSLNRLKTWFLQREYGFKVDGNLGRSFTVRELTPQQVAKLRCSIFVAFIEFNARLILNSSAPNNSLERSREE